MYTWLKLLAQLRAQGLGENVSDLDGVKSFLTEKNFGSIAGPDGKTIDLDKLYEVHTKTPKTTLRLTAEAEPDKTEIVDLEAKVAAEVEKALKARAPVGADRTVVLTDEERREEVRVKSLEEGWKESAPSGEKRLFKTHALATAFGHYLLAGPLAKHPAVPNHLSVKAAGEYTKMAHNLSQKQYMTFPNSAGGALTATEFGTEIFQQLREYGVAAREATVVPMNETRKVDQAASGELDVYYPEEGGTVSTTKQTHFNHTLRARKAMAMGKASREILQDSVANLGDHFARELSRAFAKKEDNCVFIGDGSSTYGGMIGLSHIWGATTAASDARSVTGGDTTPEHSRDHLIEVLSKLVFGRENAKWYGDPSKLAMVFKTLGLEQGGSTMSEFNNVGYTMVGLGRPMVAVNVMNSNMAVGSDVIDLFFGDLRQTVVIGRRQDLIIELSTDRYFDEDNIAIKGTMRHDIYVRGAGSTTVAGSMIALYQT